jgi:hypothetical protein
VPLIHGTQKLAVPMSASGLRECAFELFILAIFLKRLIVFPVKLFYQFVDVKLNTLPMTCEERVRLEREDVLAEAAFDAADQRLRKQMGVCPKDELQSLDQTLNDIWIKLLRARTALDRHIREHGC